MATELIKIQKWIEEAFGKPHNSSRILARVKEEMEELEGEVDLDLLRRNRGHLIGKEIADVIITLCQLANCYSLDLDRCIEEKMEINKGRKWKTLGDGTGYHIKE